MISYLNINNLRNLNEVSCGPFGKLNILTGDNGAGKTSFLEALNILSTGRSFRTNQIANVINNDSQQLTLFCQKDTNDRIGMSRNRRGEYQVKMNQQAVDRLSTIAKYLPVRVMTPESFLMLTAGAQARRQYIDFSVFHVEHSFNKDIQTYQKLLKQRNAQLKSTATYEDIVLWDKQMIPLIDRISRARSTTFESMLPYFKHFQDSFLPQYDVQYSIRSGTEPHEDLAQAYIANYQNDKKYGHTSIGPHKADINIKINNTDAYQVLSRGELKMMVAVLILAQVKWLLSKQSYCCLVIDDLSSELDTEKQALILNELMAIEGLQTFMTSIDLPEYIQNNNHSDIKMFHVEHGDITTR
jgi:DNA replication and repair protein RecF